MNQKIKERKPKREVGLMAFFKFRIHAKGRHDQQARTTASNNLNSLSKTSISILHASSSILTRTNGTRPLLNPRNLMTRNPQRRMTKA